MLTGGLAGFHPSKRQPLPGTQKLWEGVRFLSLAVIKAKEEWNRKVGDWRASFMVRCLPESSPTLKPKDAS